MKLTFRKSTLDENWPATPNQKEEVTHIASLSLNRPGRVDSYELGVETFFDHWIRGLRRGTVRSYFITSSTIGKLLRKWGFTFHINVSLTRWPASSISETSPKDSKPLPSVSVE